MTPFLSIRVSLWLLRSAADDLKMDLWLDLSGHRNTAASLRLCRVCVIVLLTVSVHFARPAPLWDRLTMVLVCADKKPTKRLELFSFVSRGGHALVWSGGMTNCDWVFFFVTCTFSPRRLAKVELRVEWNRKWVNLCVCVGVGGGGGDRMRGWGWGDRMRGWGGWECRRHYTYVSMLYICHYLCVGIPDNLHGQCTERLDWFHD